MRRALRATPLLVLASLLVLLSAATAPAARQKPLDKSEIISMGNLQVEEDDPAGVGQLDREACFTDGYSAPSDTGGVPGIDKDLSCDDAFPPDNETAIAAHPTNPDLLLGGTNDYQLFFNGVRIVQHVPAGYFFSADGGAHWIDGEVPMRSSFGAGDPAPAFNLKYGKLMMASLSFVCGQGAPFCARGNLTVATADIADAVDEFNEQLAGSTENPQIDWQPQNVINGEASDVADVEIFWDKEYITVDNYATIPNPRAGEPGQPATIDNPNYGNTYMVAARFRIENALGTNPNEPPPAYDESPIWFMKSENGGLSWTEPVEISGRSLTKCTFQDDPDDTGDTTGDQNPSGIAETPDDPQACDQDQFAYPTVAPDGTVYVHFHNEQHTAAYEAGQLYDSQIMVVKSNDGGDTWYGDLNPAEQAGCVPNPNAADGVPVLVDAGSPGTRDDVYSSCIVPIHVVDLEDSYDEAEEEGAPTFTADYPINVQGRTTLTNQQFRVNSAGTITTAPLASGAGYRLYVVFADNCAGIRPGVAPEFDPAAPPITDTNLYYAYSDDGGQTWVGGDGPNNGRKYNACSAGLAGSGRLIAKPGPDGDQLSVPDDQWFPWIDARPGGSAAGLVGPGAVAAIGFDAGLAPPSSDGPILREQYGASGLVAGPAALGVPPDFEPVPAPAPLQPGALNAAPSNPRLSRFFRTESVDPANPCPFCSRFIGDYNGIAVDSLGRIHGHWTDMRKPMGMLTPLAGGTPLPVFGEDPYYARRPITP